LWARTGRCEAPNCGAEIPLVRSFWLSRKASRKYALRYLVVRLPDRPPYIELQVFKPAADTQVPSATVTGAKATCPACKTVLAPLRVRAQLVSQRGGAETIFDETGRRVGGATLLAIVSLKAGKEGRHYRVAKQNDYLPVWRAQQRLKGIENERQQGDSTELFPIPNEPINPIRPSPNARGLSAVTRYGMETFNDLFSARQKLSLATLTMHLRKRLETSNSYLPALLEGRLVDFLVSVARWKAGAECPVQALARQALPKRGDCDPAVGDRGTRRR
jgi:putative DNA methylase